MGYAVRSDGLGFRAVASATDVTADETYSEIAPALAMPSALVIDARAALDDSDMAAMRCYKAGIAFPTAWQAYVAALRAIVNGTDTASTTLPTKPAYPSGT